ncbi:ribosome maturation protein RimP [Novosphingobium sp. PS1R-30]|uniref:Ribosome maturation factor RimP n=1 Tax=Novosphingobium anseongense TaxID=3133436 RepID=A0ABU8S0L3_9SPHN
MADIARIIEIVEPEAKALGFELVRVVYFRGGEIGPLSEADEYTLQIMAERPETGQLVLDDCAALSHRISDRIDELEAAGDVLIGDAYRLEVSSPGIDRPLTRVKDFADWTGHEAKVQLVSAVADNRKALQGDIVAIEDGVIAFDDRKSGRVSFPFSDVQSAKLILTDRLIAATRPLEADGAEEIFEEQEDS